MREIFFIYLTLVMVLATESKYCLVDSMGVYGVVVKHKNPKIKEESNLEA